MLSFNSQAQTPTWQWAKKGGGMANDYANGIATDKDGNVCITGSFESPSITFGSNVLINTASNNTDDVYIVKYDPSGNVLWAKGFGGTGSDAGIHLSTDASGNIYVTGYFISSNMMVGATTLVNTGTNSSDLFLAKFDPSGNLIWVKSAGGNGGDTPASLAISPNGNVSIAGAYSSNKLVFANDTLVNFDNSGNTQDIFVASYNSSGVPLWGKTAGGIYSEVGYGIASDSLNNLIVTGGFESASITFGTLPPLSNIGVGNDEGYLVKFDVNGTALWDKRFGGGNSESGYDVTIDVANNIYIAGTFQSPYIYFGQDTLVNTNPATGDGLVLKYSSGGTEIWGRSIDGTAEDVAYGIVTDPIGNVFVTGYFQSVLLVSGQDSLVNASNLGDTFDAFIIKFSVSGNTQWAQRAGGTNFDYGMKISRGNNGAVSVVGQYLSSGITFGAHFLSNASTGNDDVYVATLTEPGTVIHPPSALVSVPTFLHSSDLFIVPGLNLGTQLKIYNMLGQIVYTSDNYQNDFSIQNLAEAFYVYSIETSTGFGKNGKFCVLR